ncbi:MAG: signal peptide peptidase SppA [Dehalococcoidia bacterium]|nr:signal peptide peptidase SppA [Dehalococcoidia bacterium]MDW8120074.1 signal peptide peptidase SppA [Chloroflexota bacterium]
MLFLRPRIGRIALIEVHGTIGGGVRPTQLEPLLEAVRRVRWIRGLVLDINSPGGSAGASDYLYRQVKAIAQNKPVVAFIREVGASGAYYIACGAHYIVASPAAVVGSIGVLSLHPVVEALLQRWGVQVGVYKGGRLKDMGAPWRPPTAEERAKLQSLVDDFYNLFVSVVAEGRKMAPERVREVATGETFLAARGKELGLIDAVGDQEQALEKAAQMAGIRRRVITLRPHRPLLARLLQPAGDALVEGLWSALEARLWQSALPQFRWPWQI